MTINLDELERLAKAAICVPGVPDGFLVPLDLDARVAFRDAANPAAILSITAEIRQLRAELAACGDLNAEVVGLREENEALESALADCREAAFVEEIDNPYLAGAVSDPLEVPGFVAYAVEWLTGMVDIAKGAVRAKEKS